MCIIVYGTLPAMRDTRKPCVCVCVWAIPILKETHFPMDARCYTVDWTLLESIYRICHAQTIFMHERVHWMPLDFTDTHTHAAAAEDRRSTSLWMTALVWRKIDYTWKESEQNHLCEHLKQRKRTKYNIFAFMLWAERLWLDRCAASCLMVHSYDFTILQYYMHIAQTTQIPN